jgi:hypothetical protein
MLAQSLLPYFLPAWSLGRKGQLQEGFGVIEIRVLGVDAKLFPQQLLGESPRGQIQTELFPRSVERK